MKKLLSLLIVAVMVFGMIVPATPLHAHATTITADSTYVDYQKFGREVAEAAAQLKFPEAGVASTVSAGAFIADCPACGAKNAEWYARGDSSGWKNNLIEAASGRHYYLVGDITQIQKTSSGNTCVHLNGHNAINTATAAGNAIVAGAGVLNIMGEGTVAGNRTDGDTNNKTANIYGTATVNLYGGTYTQADPDNTNAEPVFGTASWTTGITLNLFDGAEIVGCNTVASGNGSAIVLEKGTINIYGGRVAGQNGAATGEVIRVRNAGNLNIYGGVIETAGTANCDVRVGAGTVKVAGNPVIAKLEVVTGGTIEIGELTSGASIGYAQESSQNPRVAEGKGAYAGKYIYAYKEGGAMINAKTGNLTYAAPALHGSSGNYNYCPYCDEAIEPWLTITNCWKLDASTYNTTHYKLGTNTAKNGPVYIYGNNCLYMNNSTLSSQQTDTSKEQHIIAMTASSTVNIMGKGTIIGNAAKNGAEAIKMSTSTLRLYGATVQKNTEVSTTQLLSIGSGATMVLGDGATIYNPGSNSDRAVTASGGTVYMEGGTIDGSLYANSNGSVIANSGTAVGYVELYSATLTVNGGTFRNTSNVNNGATSQCKKVDTSVSPNTVTVYPAHVADAATCTSASVCELCNTELEAAKDHDYTNGACANCGKTQCQVEGHTMATVEGKAATCVETGLTDGYACTRCDYVGTAQKVTEASGHNMADGVCSICGMAEAQKTTVTDNLAFVGDTKVAYCPVCDDDVTWTAMAKDAQNVLTGGHYYLAEDGGLAEAGTYILVKGGTNCVHLNGKNITNAGGTMLDFGATSTLNLMGTGNVSSKVNSGSVLNLGWTSTVNVYSGTYYCTGTGPAIQTYTTNDTKGITIHKDAVVGTAEHPYGLNLNGSSTVTIDGATVQQVKAVKFDKFTLTGATKIAKLEIASGKLITLGALTEGASIAVDATGAFTAAIENAEAVAAYFTAVDSERMQVEAVEGVLTVTAKETYKPAPVLGYTDNLIFSESDATRAWCAACGEEVAWTAWDGTSQLIPVNGGHYYLTAPVEYAKNGSAIWVGGTSSCFHLNGKDLINPNGNVINTGNAAAKINVLGSGNVSGNGAYGATIYHAYGEMKLYGGTYTKAETATGSTATLIRLNNGAKLHLDDAVTIDALDPETEVVIYADSNNSSYTVNGATVNGKLSLSGGQALTVSGAADLSYVVVKSGSKITVKDLAAEAKIGIAISKIAEATVFADNAAQYKDNFFAGVADATHIIEVDGALALEAHAIEEEIILEATCTEIGLKNVSCDCGYAEENVEIEATGHEEGAPTCTEAQICGKCGEVVAEATGHIGEEVEIKVVEATCAKPGYREVVTTCSVCEKEIYNGKVEIPALPHTPGETIKVPSVEATCENAGYNAEYTSCTECGGLISLVIVPVNPLPHTYEGGICTGCGAEEPTVAPSEPAEEIVAEFGGVQMGLNAALEAAAVNGGTVKLIANATAGKVIVWKGVTLDLNGKTLTADYISANFTTAEVIDSGNRVISGASTSTSQFFTDGGQLIVPEDCLFLDKTNEYFVVRTAENTFEFAPLVTRTSGSSVKLQEDVANYSISFYGHKSTAWSNKPFYQDVFVNNTAEDLGVKIRIVIRGVFAGQPSEFVFEVDDSFIKSNAASWEGKNISCTATGLESLGGNYDIYTEIAFVGANGTTVSVYDRVLNYPKDA